MYLGKSAFTKQWLSKHIKLCVYISVLQDRSLFKHSLYPVVLSLYPLQLVVSPFICQLCCFFSHLLENIIQQLSRPTLCPYELEC